MQYYIFLFTIKSTKSRNSLISRNSHISILRMRRQNLTSTTSAISDKLCIFISLFSFIFVIIVLFLRNVSNSIDFETPIKNVNVIYTKRILSKAIVTIFYISTWAPSLQIHRALIKFEVMNYTYRISFVHLHIGSKMHNFDQYRMK